MGITGPRPIEKLAMSFSMASQMKSSFRPPKGRM
jgi:hypothetical protein